MPIHFRDFELKLCFIEADYLKCHAKATDDKLIYHLAGIKYTTASKVKLAQSGGGRACC